MLAWPKICEYFFRSKTEKNSKKIRDISYFLNEQVAHDGGDSSHFKIDGTR